MERHTLHLTGPWHMTEAGTADWLPATVPGCVHTDLLAAGRIPDPWWRDNEKAIHWVWERDWVYERAFTVAPELLACPRAVLVCEGLDTLATVEVNGAVVLETDNMFHAWETDVRERLRAGGQAVGIPSQADRCIAAIDCAGLGDARDLLVWAWVEAGGAPVSSNLALFAKPRHLRLADARIDCVVRAAGDCECALALRPPRLAAAQRIFRFALTGPAERPSLN